MSKLEEFIKRNLPKVLAKETANSLGDRSKYIGSSDIGSCLRKAYLSKTQNEVHSIKQQIIFERGHLAEGIVAKMIQGTPYKKQVEAIGKTNNNFPLKAHIDFVVDFGSECVVIEAKSTNTPIEEPYEGWILQVQLQMGLLKPQCDKQSKKVRGYILAMDVNTGWYKTFEVMPNETLFNIAMDKANTLANSLVNKVCPNGEEQLYCSSCSFKGDCPAVTRGAVESLPEDVAQVVHKLQFLKSTEKEIKSLKEQLKDFFIATEKTAAKADNYTVRLTTVKDTFVADVKLLQSKYPEIFEKVKKIKKGYNSVKII